MGWHARLELRYRKERERTVCRDAHEGPLRVLASLYPEGAPVCHQVLVHPPAGIVGGDALLIGIALEAGAHALVTSAGCSRFYRSAGETALQSVRGRLERGARLEWLPLAAIAYSGALAANRLRFELDRGAEMIGWDLLALGMPACGARFASGRFVQEIELPGVWLERGAIRAGDRLLASPLGWAGEPVLATVWHARAEPLSRAVRDSLLDAAREASAASPLAARAGVTSPDPRVVVMRALAPQIEPAMALATHVWSRWREAAWRLPACVPRVWAT